MDLPQNEKGSPYNKKASKRIGGLADPLAPINVKKGRGILRNPYGLAQSSFQEDRRGRVLGLYVKRPSLENLLKPITI